MKITTKLILLGMVGLAAAPFILKKPDGTPWLNLKELLNSTDKAVAKVEEVIPTPKKPTKMYKWQDSEGKWHFSDKPSNDFDSSKVQLDAAYNQMKHIDLPDGFGDGKKDEDQRFNPEDGNSTVPLTTAPLEKVPEMLQEIERVQDRMEERQKILNDL